MVMFVSKKSKCMSNILGANIVAVLPSHAIFIKQNLAEGYPSWFTFEKTILKLKEKDIKNNAPKNYEGGPDQYYKDVLRALC